MSNGTGNPAVNQAVSSRAPLVVVMAPSVVPGLQTVTNIRGKNFPIDHNGESVMAMQSEETSGSGAHEVLERLVTWIDRYYGPSLNTSPLQYMHELRDLDTAARAILAECSAGEAK